MITNIRKREKQKLSFILHDYKQWTANICKHHHASSPTQLFLSKYLKNFYKTPCNIIVPLFFEI